MSTTPHTNGDPSTRKEESDKAMDTTSEATEEEEDNPSPPTPGAIMDTVRNGKNAGRRYWCIRNKMGKFDYFAWIDKEESFGELLTQIRTLRQKVGELESEKKHLLNLLATKIKN